MNNPIKFEREFKLKNIGNPRHLPRGKAISGEYGDVDDNFWRSVFNGGEAAAKQMKEDRERETREWKEKIVVDTLSVEVGGFVCRDKTIPADKNKDILHGTPKKNW